MAENQFLMTMLEAGSTNVSNLLLHHYHDIDMTTGELMVYLELKSYIDRGTRPPTSSWLPITWGPVPSRCLS
ncbi:hypothetical protein LFLT20_14540 [Limosilactobacillus fermentum]|nr:hypothetical protein [Limosilactobacillus fermentum]GIC74450.1 hypothetical protein LFLT20_14540 [Limosilactobacillus fermentum]